MCPDQNEETNFCRQAITNTPRMFSMLAATPEGRAELKKHRTVAKTRLKTETDWRERGYAAYMILAIDAVVKRKRTPKRTAVSNTASELRRMREDLKRIQRSAEFACNMLWVHAWEKGEVGTFGARNGAHDDIVLAVALAVYGLKSGRQAVAMPFWKAFRGSP
jgi:hypothetical protein